MLANWLAGWLTWSLHDWRNKFKKVLIGFGVVSFVLVSIFIFSMIFLKHDKSRYDEIAEGFVSQIVNGLSELSHEQFNAYWGPSKPGKPEQREAMISGISKLGVLIKIDRIEQYKYLSKFTFKGIRHFYTYRVYATYSNAPAVVTIHLKGQDGKLTPSNLQFN